MKQVVNNEREGGEILAKEAAPDKPTQRQEAKPPSSQPADQPQRRKRLWRVVMGGAVAALVICAVFYYWLFLHPYESTDDAFVDGDVIPIAPQVPGLVSELCVRDNQSVKQSELLLEIDPRDYEAKLAQARAGLLAAQMRLDQSQAQVDSDEAKAREEVANLVAARAESERSQADFRRYSLVESPAVSRSQLDSVVAEARSTAAALEVASNRITAAKSQVLVSQAAVQTASAEVQSSEAAVRQAQLDLSYTSLTAPADSYVTHRAVEAGSYVETGQTLLALVPKIMWVTANFKETQLTYMRPGQPVKIHVDAFPNHIFRGHVDSIQRGSGARFSLLPPENATGNYVKVVQRVPVKIVFDDPPDPDLPMGPGMSVEPTVKVH